MSVAEFKTPAEPKTPANTSTTTTDTKSQAELAPRITVVGVGGAGGNAVNNMIRSKLQGVQFIVCNTDAQALNQSLADRRIQLGDEVTQGLGAGSKPEVGRAAAEESLDLLVKEITGSHMVFITAGMGGGTGTGAAPVVAKAARERGILTVAVVTKPFHFEGSHRMRTADKGIDELSQHVDTLIIIPNQNLFRVATEKTTFADAFKMADDVLHSGVRGVTDLMIMPGLINLDFADIRTVMSEMGKAMMGTGEATGDGRAILAAEAAISNPLLDDLSMRGAQGVLINITGGLDMTLYEADEAANRVREEVDPEANFIFGATFDEKMEGRIRVSVVATGIESDGAKVRIQRYLDEKDMRSNAASFGSLEGEAGEGAAFIGTEDQDGAESGIEEGIGEISLEADTNDDAMASSGAADLDEMYGAAGQGGQPNHHSGQFFSREEEEAYYAAMAARARQNADAYGPEKPQKRGFFSRLAETVRGGASRSPRDMDMTSQAEYQRRLQEDAQRYYAEVTESKKGSGLPQHAERDIPAYLRRNKNS